MIKSVFTAHLSEYDKKDLTLLINDRSIGSLSPENKSNYVLTSSREVHMVSGFSNQSIYYDPRFNSDRIYLWNQAFKEMQSQGLKAFPSFIDDHHIYSEYLYLFTSDIFIGWQDRNNGLYLFRNGRLYRLQPTILPPNVFDPDWMQHTDFYSFVPKISDIVFSITEKVFERLDINKIEKILQDSGQLATSMSRILNLLRTYNRKLDLSWIGFEFERIEKNLFAGEIAEDLANFEGQTRLSQGKRDFTRLINSSRVSRVKDGQRLIPAPKAAVNLSIKSNRLNPRLSHSGQANEYDFNMDDNRSSTKITKSNHRSSFKEDRLVRQRNLEKLESQRPHSDIVWDNVRSFSFEPIIANLKSAVKNFFSLIPHKPILSKFLATSIILVAIVLFTLIGTAIGLRSKTDSADIPTETTPFITRKISLDEEVVPPDSALLEVDITVKANNLQVRQAPRSDAPLVATVQRGAKVTQLSEPNNNWVFIRLDDGKTVGYAYAKSLLD
ncbi:MAG TPA: SH3 domain-containing protein [Clostridiaceae bacterium]|nr:SH3 domain-containing protein [Clostridiaceae bacterium]